ncbi:MAG: N-acetyl-gamma-glutamyl-phosphate reductase [Frankiaceae bacterium]|jgi:N-acetyl-gamma-glutamyl-phosphate reductase|nr:N-acetyl-gamma-glutamyl-phosphate reductase [Frankiaceae bacterium]
MGLTVGVAGASGYAGGELLRLLSSHPDVELGPLAAGSSAGELVTALHPQLRSLAGRRFVPTNAAELAGCELVLLALPHGESAALVGDLAADAAVVDLGADFRLADPTDWQQYYGTPHAGTWTYGLPELPGGRAAIRASRRVANPGCYATAVPLALVPLLRAGLAEPSDLVVVAASGTSGAGRAAKSALLGSEVMGDLSAYRVAGHQHTPEVLQTLQAHAGDTTSLSFTTVLAPMSRGILATCTARLRHGSTAVQLREALASAYADEPFVHVLDEGQWPHTAATLGSNSCHLQVTADLRAGRAVVVAALDNLGKGAAGQAIQNMNLVLGLPEGSGLPLDGVAP